MKRCLILLLTVLLYKAGLTQPVNPRPTTAQLAWQDMEYYFFMHFGPNTFTGLEWGKGNENAEIFDPSDLNTDQWCRIAKAAGAKGIIITAKHHDGFCLWPSKYSTHTIGESDWKDGKGDILRDLSNSCKKYGLKFGVYLSPWDRNHPDYGTPAYNDVFVNMMKEIFANYGPIWEFWWDGANGEGPNGKKQVYDFARYEQVVRKLSPNTIIFSDIGPDARWAGNEKGFIGATNWNTLDTVGFKRGLGAPSTDTLNRGNIYGKNWIPAECDVSIRPGWFYHKSEDSLVKTPEELFNIYLKSVGRGANLILNVPPDTRGQITAHDSASLINFKKLRDESFKNDLSKNAFANIVINGKSRRTSKITDHQLKTFESLPDKSGILLKLKSSQKINCLLLQENLAEGQNCISFSVELIGNNGQINRTIAGTTIGHKRILTFPDTNVQTIRLSITAQKGPTRLAGIQIYLIDEKLITD